MLRLHKTKTPEQFDVIGIGNALVDILTHVDEGFLKYHQIPKSTMQLIDEKTMKALYADLSERIERSGGSAANTIAGIASFGGGAAFIGKVANDVLGDEFARDMKSIGVHFDTPRAKGVESTGCCIVSVTPDAQRSMSTYLGVAPQIAATDIDERITSKAKVIYLEGYLWDRDEAKHAIRKVMRTAHQQQQDIAFTLSDSFCVERHREEFIELIREYVTILFANEQEIMMLLQVDTLEKAIARVPDLCDIACLTRGAQGSVIVSEEGVLTVAAEPNIKVVDTTGAGDLYAAGFLYGYTQGYDFTRCGSLASKAAAEVISHVGARPEKQLKGLL